MKAIMGRKLGMTQVFGKDGTVVPVTVIEALPNVVLQKKTKEKDGYESVKLGFEDAREKVLSKPIVGQFKEANAKPKRFIREVKGFEELNIGDEVKVSVFNAGEMVDVSGVSKGHGFSGPIKRHNYSLQGRVNVSKNKRSIGGLTGSAGSKFATRIMKGTKMPGHYGVENTTVQNLEVILVDENESLILVKGSVPGPRKSMVMVKSGVLTDKVKPAFELVDLQEVERKNALLEQAKKAGADVNTDMSVAELQAAVEAAQQAKQAEEEKLKAEETAKAESEQAAKAEEAAAKAKEEAEKKQAEGANDADEAAKKAAELEAIAQREKEEAAKAQAEASAKAVEAAAKAAEADKLQVHDDEANDDKEEK